MLKYSKLSTYKIKKILKCFSEDLPSVKTAEILGLNRRTTDRYYNIIREKIAMYCLEEARFSGEMEIDESYFGARRIRGKRG